ncbi:MAG: excinuclease ABC subunit UvrA [Bacteroidales bacterium]|jgi:excinuclease ABC subunit A|nr:excinuclease ABC subunit UvrA [Bacteroidales bacterium]MDD2263520.1 excinuclease ABC subunit UvrA [Bacteroidales bacterium]MDD2830690.1 excinuclease ABC subunit UvrA [Bacteroidales bacterium]MDD3207889.1 excinuclease ABC subunit UvrA [Bacteroidales bacterium]MDD3696604.1 excinuclease ABC subunit UvrA [Bacteroidales bacterium]
MAKSYIRIEGARVNNLKNISLDIPRHSLCIITGLSGSGKSSLAFDTLHAEGQRRYLETLSSYARQYLGTLQRPDVDYISGLSPIIAIEQKTTTRNPRSTVGTVTEIYDFLRLLFARASIAYSPVTGKPMIRYTAEQMVSLIAEQYDGKKCILLAPVVKGRKGHYRELLDQILKKGFLEVRIDGTITQITHNMMLDRYKAHFIEIVIDKLIPAKGCDNDNAFLARLRDSVNTALYHGNGSFAVLDPDTGQVSHFSKHLMCPESGLSFPEPAPHSFSFNSPLGACPVCKGLGFTTRIDLKKIIPDDSLSIAQGGLEPFGKYRDNTLFHHLEGLAKKYGFSLHTPIAEIPEEAMDTLLYGSEDLIYVHSPVGGTYTITFPGLINRMEQMNSESEGKMASWERHLEEIECPACHGSRLNQTALCFRFGDKNIAELSAMDIQPLASWLDGIEERISDRQKAIATDVLKEIRDRLQFLIDVGLSYLSLNRGTRTLSGGESQRIRLATQIGSTLVNVLYILDEPSIGLHQWDNRRLIHALMKLRNLGNSVIVVEHDEEIIRSADWLVDLGPGAGRKGGNLLYSGPMDKFLQQSLPQSLTWQYLKGIRSIPVPSVRRPGNGHVLRICGASGNNLKHITVDFPLGCFVCITGISGSGKSTLVNETLLPVLTRKFYRSKRHPLPHESVTGIQYIDKVVEVDQSPIGKTPRSNPATYTNVFGEIRKLFASSPDAKTRGFKSSRFSFNIRGGRCEACKGAGIQLIEMNFLPDVHITCPECQGKRYKSDTLAVRYKNKNINQVLDMSVNEAVEFFRYVPSIIQKIKTLQDVGLGYIKLGQPSTTLSGGECQRVKLAAELSRTSTGNTLYILDEPTTGLHFEDVRVLLNILQQLTDKGNTVLIIEHHPDIIRSADYIIDLGPEGGKDGGFVVGYGTPEALAENLQSYTGRLLREWLH